MNDTVNTTTTVTPGCSSSTYQFNPSTYCFNRLPCGYCMRLERPCPMQGNTVVTPGWQPDWYKITCNTEGNNG